MKKPLSVLILAAVLLAVTLATGVVHGTRTNRWGPQPDLVAAAKLLEETPDQVAGWHRLPSEDLDPRVSEMLQCRGSLCRVYEHAETGERVSVFVLLGPAGPIAVHTPEICYSSKDYRIVEDRQRWPINEHEDLWDLRLKRNDLSETPLRVVYGWTNDRQWHATDWPRFAYGGRPLLYKLQMAGPVPGNENQDACRDFLNAFLPLLQKHLAQDG